MAKLNDYTAVTRFDSNGILMTDGSSGTRKITAKNAALDLAGMVSAVQHRNVYGGRNLGNTITDAQWTAISSGTFDDLYIGDYWRLNNVTWVIADMDYFYNCGDTSLTKHHLVVISNRNLYDYAMNAANTTEGGYIGSKMYTEGLAQALTMFESAFGSEHVLSHRDYFINAVTSGAPFAGAWYDSKVELMNEVMVCGCYHSASMNKGSTDVNKFTVTKQQLALFRLNPNGINTRQTYWLRDVVSSTQFACIGASGDAYYHTASNARGVRPYAVIGV